MIWLLVVGFADYKKGFSQSAKASILLHFTLGKLLCMRAVKAFVLSVLLTRTFTPFNTFNMKSRY